MKLYYDHDRISIARYRNSSTTFSNCITTEFEFQPTENLLRPFHTVSRPNFNVPKILKDISKTCLRRNSIASCSSFSETFWTFVLAELQLHRAENIGWHFQVCLSRNPIATYLKYSKTFSTCVLVKVRLHPYWKLFSNIFDLCVSRKSIPLYRKYSETFQNCITTGNQLHLTEIILRHFKTVSRPKNNWIVPKFFQNLFETVSQPKFN